MQESTTSLALKRNGRKASLAQHSLPLALTSQPPTDVLSCLCKKENSIKGRRVGSKIGPSLPRHRMYRVEQKKIQLSSVTHVPPGQMGFASAALSWWVAARREIQTCRNFFAPPCRYARYFEAYSEFSSTLILAAEKWGGKATKNWRSGCFIHH